MRFVLASLLLTGLIGCGSKVQGKIDDEKPMAIRDGYWFAVGSGDNEVISLVLTTIPQACETGAAYYDQAAEAYEDYFDSFDADALSDDLSDAEEDNLPEEYWSYSFTIDADPDDEEDVADDYDIEQGRGSDALLIVTWKHDYTDWDQVLLEQDSDGYNADTYNAEDGALTITAFKEDGGIKGTAEAELEDTDRDNAGDISIKFQEIYCEEVEDAFERYIESVSGIF